MEDKAFPSFNEKLCCYCSACVGVCPSMAIELKETKILMDTKKCIKCYSCVRICPVGAWREK